MKKLLIIVLIGISYQYSCHINKKIIASNKRVLSYEPTKDDSTVDPRLVITTKKLLLSFMDSLEIILGDKIDTIPFVKFGLVSSTPSNVWYLYAGMYDPVSQTVYFRSDKDYLIAKEAGVVHMPDSIKAQAKDFERIGVHELIHYYHDVLMRKVAGKSMAYLRNGNKNTLIEYTVTVEGVAEYIEGIYHANKDGNYIPTNYFPDALLEDVKKYPDEQLFWRKYGVSFVGPILDISIQRGLRYLILHPFKIKNNFHTSAGEYQRRAIAFLSKDKK